MLRVVIRICSFALWVQFPVVNDLVDLAKLRIPSRFQVREKLLDSGQLQNRHMVLHLFLVSCVVDVLSMLGWSCLGDDALAPLRELEAASV